MCQNSDLPNGPAMKQISTSDDRAIPVFTAAFSSAFRKSPPIVAFSNESYPTSSDPIHAFFENYVTESLPDSSNLLVEAGNMSAVAVWEVPERSPTPPTTRGPVIGDFKRQLQVLKQKHLGTTRTESSGTTGETTINPHYTLDTLARNPNVPRVPGAVRATIQPILEKARLEGVKVWLEAAEKPVIEMYEWLGFEVVDELTFGSGVVNEFGIRDENGRGVTLWCMVWSPDGQQGT